MISVLLILVCMTICESLLDAPEKCTVVINIVRKSLSIAFKDWAVGQVRQGGGGGGVGVGGRQMEESTIRQEKPGIDNDLDTGRERQGGTTG